MFRNIVNKGNLKIFVMHLCFCLNFFKGVIFVMQMVLRFKNTASIIPVILFI